MLRLWIFSDKLQVTPQFNEMPMQLFDDRSSSRNEEKIKSSERTSSFWKISRERENDLDVTCCSNDLYNSPTWRVA